MQEIFPNLFILPLLFLCLHCGGGGGGETTESSDDTGNQQETINTQKLVGTPFEGRTTGDDLPWSTFVCGKYQTTTIDAFPIKIFAAFFTPSEEAIIQEGIDLANAGAELTLYELTNTWADDVRVIYKVNKIIGEDGDFSHVEGYAIWTDYRFDGKSVAAVQAADWAIEVKESMATGKYLIAHELGHATGMRNHDKIDYENNVFGPLEPDSIMNGRGGTVLNDYNFMMQMQGQIMIDHLGQPGEFMTGQSCE